MTLGRARAIAAAAAGAAILVLALVPSPAGSPLGRVANVDGESSDPTFDTAVDAAALRRAGDLLPAGSHYLLVTPGASPLLQGNLLAATQLFLAAALPVQTPEAAEWALVYRDVGAGVPAGLRAARTTRIGRHVTLVELARRGR